MHGYANAQALASQILYFEAESERDRWRYSSISYIFEFE